MSLIFSDKVKSNRDEFLARVKKIAGMLGIDPNWLMIVMNSESGLNHKAVNKFSNATGLIQFMPKTAKWIGTSINSLANMSNVEQLEYVYRYFNFYKKHIKSYTDLYLITFYPIALTQNWPDFKTLPPIVVKQNAVMDLNKNGILTVGEVRAWVLSRVPQKALEIVKKKESPSSLPSLSV